MKKIMIGAALWLLTVPSAFSQTKNITVTGRVMEDTKEPAIQATVQLLSLPDSAQTAGVASSAQGYFTLPKVKAGKYVLKVSYIGFKTKYLPLQLSESMHDRNVGTLTLETDAVMLSEAVVTAEAPQVQVVEDTIAFNSSAYRTPEGAMLEELVKKLPGAEVDDEGTVKINGKEIKKIMVDGKEFFGGDVKTGLKNLPVDMVEKLKTYDKKSDLARITGIDDGEEETVLDLTVKKGMNQGIFGNLDLAGGTKDRYMGHAMLNYFRENTQVSVIAGANNVNDQGFSGGGGGPRWRRNNGLTATKELGVNFATETDKIEMGGSVRYNYKDNDLISVGSTENFLTNGNSYSNSNSRQRNKSRDFNVDFRLEWKPDTMTNIIFRPDLSYSKSDNYSNSKSATFNVDPYQVVVDPNNYLADARQMKKLFGDSLV
ncbi:carboxypeptidase-like regulatory domain-containing protein, partial [Bacteroides heparinolyticus]